MEFTLECQTMKAEPRPRGHQQDLFTPDIDGKDTTSVEFSPDITDCRTCPKSTSCTMRRQGAQGCGKLV